MVAMKSTNVQILSPCCDAGSCALVVYDMQAGIPFSYLTVMLSWQRFGVPKSQGARLPHLLLGTYVAASKACGGFSTGAGTGMAAR
jgi:hypothetical protein